MLSTDTIIGNRYIVKRKLAEGGMAEIYLCTAKGLEGFEKEVVIKCIRSFWGSDDLFVKMFIAEAHLASRLNHANIVQIFDFDKHEDSYYLAMEYVNGPSLRDFLRKTKEKDLPLPILMASEIVANIARGLHYAHNLNIVHRDVSPHNILLSFDGDIKLADFGIAKTDSQLTSPGVLKGKFAYMAPEQARGEAVDARTDIFSLGIVLWETLTRSRLFEYDSYINTLQALQENLIVQPSRFNTDVPEALDRIVLKALSRNAAERYQTAQELERALVNFILNHAHSADDTNLSHFLKLVYDDAASPPQEPKNPTRTYTPSHPAALAHPPPLPPTTSDADSPLPPDTLPQRRRNTPSPLPAPPEPPNNTTTEEFSYPSAKTTAPKNHKPFSRFLKHPIAIISSLAVLVGTGTYVFSWKNSRKPQPHLATHLELNASQTNSPPASPPPLTQNPKPLDQTELPPPEPAQPKNEANPPPQTTPPPTENLKNIGTPTDNPPPADKTLPADKTPPVDKTLPANKTPPVDKTLPVNPTSSANKNLPAAPVVDKMASQKPSKKEATLTLSAFPWASVTITNLDNNSLRREELSGTKSFRLPLGNYQVKFSHPAKDEVRIVQAQQTKTYRVTFQAISTATP